METHSRDLNAFAFESHILIYWKLNENRRQIRTEDQSQLGWSHLNITLRLAGHADGRLPTCLFKETLCSLDMHQLLPPNVKLTFRHRAPCILGQAFRCSPENAFYIFNQQIYFII